MNETTESKTEERAKEGFNFKKLFVGSSTKETLENTSYIVIFVSTLMVSAGIGLGSFIQGTAFISVVGALFVMVGIVAYIASRFIGE